MATTTRYQSKDAEISGDTALAEAEAPAPGSFMSLSAYSRNAHRLILGYCFFAALSIAASQTFLLGLITYWIFLAAKNPAARPWRDSRTIVLAAPLVNWLLVCLLTAATGIDPARSIVEAVKSSVFLLLPFAVFSSFTAAPLAQRQFISRVESYVAALLLSQCFAALHTVLSELVPSLLPPLVPGPLTESGQLVLVIPLVLAAIFYSFTGNALRNPLELTVFGRTVPPPLYAGLLFMAFLIVAWPGAILWDESSLSTLLSRFAALTFAFLLAIPPLRRGAPAMREKLGTAGRALRFEIFHLAWPAAALLFAALLINLKRGPWLGVFVELIVLGYLLSRRLLFWSVILSFTVLLTLSPARTRVANLNEHFSISGGRKEMWELGAEIAQRYSLGLGINNARYMRELDPAIPQTHRHMHNNFLNVLVETGWIGLSVYVWWMCAVLFYGFRLWRHCRRSTDRVCRQVGVLALCLSLALLGWQVSGSVEYNFGDGEIRLIAFFYMGLLLALGSYTTFTSAKATSLNGEARRYPPQESN